MAITSGFYDSNGDRRYSAFDISRAISNLMTDGIFSAEGGLFIVTSTGGMHINIATGRAWFNDTWIYNDTDIPMTLDEADLFYKRIDAVVIEINQSVEVRANTIKIIKGIPSVNPEKPELIFDDDAKIYQYPLAYISIDTDTEEITPDDIENMVGTETTPFVVAPKVGTDITELFSKWQYDFDTWFATVVATLDENVAAKLLRMVMERVELANKALESDVVYYPPSSDKWMTPESTTSMIHHKTVSSNNITNFV